MTETAVTATDARALNEALEARPELAPRPDALGNPQTPFLIIATDEPDLWVVEHPDDVAPAVIEAAAAEVPAILAAWAAEQAEQDAQTTNATTIRDRLATTRAEIKTGIDAIQAGTLFAGLSAQERAYLRRLGIAATGLIRLELRELDSAD